MYLVDIEYWPSHRKRKYFDKEQVVLNIFLYSWVILRSPVLQYVSNTLISRSIHYLYLCRS